MNKKNIAILIILIVLIATGIIIAYFLFFQQKEVGNIKIFKNESAGCLSNTEIASYEIHKKENKVSMTDILISNKNNSQEKYRFQIELPIPDHYHPIELHKCGIYAVKSFGYNYNTRTSLPGYKAEIWKYDYRGDGEALVLIAEDALGNLKGYKYLFSTDFRIDPQEKYLVLIKSYSNKDDYALVIKNLETKEDIFILSVNSIKEQHLNIAGVFDMLEWSEDSRYFWGSISDGAYVNGFFRIDTQNWKADIYEASDGTMGGFPLNIKTGYVPIQPGQVWTGDYQLTQELKEQYRKEGKKSFLYLYNLFIKEKILIETVDEPLFSFKPRWLSDTELEYELPTGEIKIYEIKPK